MRIALLLVLLAQDVTKDELRETVGDVVPKGAWIYDDLEAARAAAKADGRPILALARCVP